MILVIVSLTVIVLDRVVIVIVPLPPSASLPMPRRAPGWAGFAGFLVVLFVVVLVLPPRVRRPGSGAGGARWLPSYITISLPSDRCHLLSLTLPSSDHRHHTHHHKHNHNDYHCYNHHHNHPLLWSERGNCHRPCRPRPIYIRLRCAAMLDQGVVRSYRPQELWRKRRLGFRFGVSHCAWAWACSCNAVWYTKLVSGLRCHKEWLHHCRNIDTSLPRHGSVIATTCPRHHHAIAMP